MNEEIIKKYVGKKCLLILNNNFQYTTIVPNIKNGCLSFVDKFGKDIDVQCSFIEYIKLAEDEYD